MNSEFPMLRDHLKSDYYTTFIKHGGLKTKSE